MVQSLRDAVWSFLEKLEIDPAIPILGIDPNLYLKSRFRRGSCTRRFTAALFTVASVTC